MNRYTYKLVLIITYEHLRVLYDESYSPSAWRGEIAEIDQGLFFGQLRMSLVGKVIARFSLLGFFRQSLQNYMWQQNLIIGDLLLLAARERELTTTIHCHAHSQNCTLQSKTHVYIPTPHQWVCTYVPTLPLWVCTYIPTLPPWECTYIPTLPPWVCTYIHTLSQWVSTAYSLTSYQWVCTYINTLLTAHQQVCTPTHHPNECIHPLSWQLYTFLTSYDNNNTDSSLLPDTIRSNKYPRSPLLQHDCWKYTPSEGQPAQWTNPLLPKPSYCHN